MLPIPPEPFVDTLPIPSALLRARPRGRFPPKGAPNVLLILIDDASYGHTRTFGGIFPTPTIDSLEKNGLRYTRFGVTALCSPTRAPMLISQPGPYDREFRDVVRRPVCRRCAGKIKGHSDGKLSGSSPCPYCHYPTGFPTALRQNKLTILSV
jgi:hypothetical protein